MTTGSRNRARRAAALGIAPVLLLLACSGQRAAEEPAPTPPAGEPAAPGVRPEAPAEQPKTQASPGETKPSTAPARDAKAPITFPPADFAPPFERSAKPGDG